MFFAFELDPTPEVGTRFRARRAEASSRMYCDRSCVINVYSPPPPSLSSLSSSPNEDSDEERRPRYDISAEVAAMASLRSKDGIASGGVLDLRILFRSCAILDVENSAATNEGVIYETRNQNQREGSKHKEIQE